MIYIHIAYLSTCFLVGINNEYSGWLHIFRVTADCLNLRWAQVCLIICKLIALNLLLLLLLVRIVHPDLRQHSLGGMGTYRTLPGRKVGRRIDE